MDEENEQTDPVTELRLDLGYANQYTENIWKNDLGAGANADSMVDRAFVTTDPLSELVWSPQKGLSLKCADFSFGAREPSMLRGIGPSNLMLALTQSITVEKSYTDKLVQHTISGNKDISSRSNMGNIGASISGLRHTIDRGIGCDGEEMSNTDGISSPCFKDEENLHGSIGEEVAAPISRQMVEAAEMIENKSLILPEHVNERKVDVQLAEKDELEPVIARLEKPAYLTGEDIVAGCGKLIMDMDYAVASDVHIREDCQPSGSRPQNQDPSSSRAMEKLESTAENELLKLKSKIVALESPCHQPVEKLQSRDESIAANCSPSNSRIHKKRNKGKKKDLFDVHVDGRNSNDKDDSHESVESCNSAEISSRCKKRWNEQQMVVESKRVKNQIHDTAGSTSFIGRDSSFMIWISNMMKGFSKSIPEKESSLALTHVHSANESQAVQHQRIGFQSIFQSLYGLSTKGQHVLSHNAYDEGEERSGDHRENSTSRGQVLRTDGKPNESTSRHENLNEFVSERSADADKTMLCINDVGSHENQMAASGEVQAASNPPTFGKDKYETSSSSFMPKRKRKNAENTDSDALSEVKTSPSLGNAGDHLNSLWITRLSLKTSRSVINLDSEDQNIDDRLLCGSHIPCSQNHVDFSSERKRQTSDEPDNILQREIQRCTVDSEYSSGFDRIEDDKDQSSVYKLNPMLPSDGLRRSVAMASVFARRLDALKHIPSNAREIGTDEKMICFFCGSRGHHLKDCSKIAESEVLEHLSKIPSLLNRVDEFSCLCIRCFQLNHWAVSCPQDVSKSHNHFRNAEKQPSNSGLNSKFLVGNCSKFQPARNHDLKLDSSEIKIMASSCMEKKESEIVPLTSSVDKQPADVQGVFDMIKKLQLSRTDILKWMNSDASLSKLEGLFLRLRLGKWEKGFDGTGYHVGFVTGTQNARNSITVNVGGVECLAKSQYISNHDFLEEEVKAWWHATSKERSQVSVEADLKAKVKRKRLLGL